MTDQLEQIIQKVDKHEQRLIEIEVTNKFNSEMLKEAHSKLDTICHRLYEGNGSPSVMERLAVCETSQTRLGEELRTEINSKTKQGKYQFLSVSVVSITAFVGVILLFLSRKHEFVDFVRSFL